MYQNICVDVRSFGMIYISITREVRDRPILSNNYATGKVLKTELGSLPSVVKNVKPRINAPRTMVS